jgi:hypothetical protein
MGNVEVSAAYVPYMWTSAATALLLLVLLAVYWCKYHPAAPIVGILGLLLFNDMLQLAFELATYMTDPPELVCLVSVVGTTFFRLASCTRPPTQTTGSSSSPNSSTARRRRPEWRSTWPGR